LIKFFNKPMFQRVQLQASSIMLSNEILQNHFHAPPLARQMLEPIADYTVRCIRVDRVAECL
jgi:hypothetical protein